MIEKINGFLILRKSLGNLFPYSAICRLGGKEYRGMQRNHLEDVAEEYYGKTLPADIHRIYKMSQEESNDLLFLNYIKNYRDALTILDYVSKKNDLNELIAIASDTITEGKGDFDFANGKIEWLGYDVIVFGGSSLILDGLFFKPEHFEKWVPLINENGLFSNKDHIHDFIKHYFIVADKGIIENYNMKVLRVDAVRIGRVLGTVVSG